MTTHIPSIDSTYRIPDQAAWDRLAKLADQGKVVNVLLAGPTGCGKTTYAEQFAAHYNRPFFSLECGSIAESDQMIGQWEVRPNADDHSAHTLFNLAGFIEAIQTPRAVILANEVNRFQSIKCENALFSLLDHQRSLYIPEIRRNVHVAKGVTFFATINEGAEYTGTDMMDLAFRGRWSRKYRLTWLDEDTEIEVLTARTGVDKNFASELVNLATNLRNKEAYPVSLRQLEAAAEEYNLGADKRTAIMTTLSSVVPEEELEMMAQVAIGDLTA